MANNYNNNFSLSDQLIPGRVSKKDPCPICFHPDGCKILSFGVMCLRTDRLNVPLGWKHIKDLRSGMGSLLVPSDQDNDDRDKDREKRYQQYDKEKQQRADALRQKELSPVDRDRYYRQLLNELSLNDRHRENLLDRGLNKSDIDRGLYRSVSRRQKLNNSYPLNLPGISASGQSLTNSDSGFLVPVLQGDLIVGLQIRSDNPKNGGKYKWLSQENNKVNIDGEIPLGVYIPSVIKIPGIRFVEGYLKAYIVSVLTGQITIGCAGGQWGYNPKQLQQFLDQYHSEKSISITLDPDAGMLENQQIFRNYRRLANFLHEQEYTLLVSDWGQHFDKNIGDIDEVLVKGTKINLITWDAYSVRYRAGRIHYKKCKKFTADTIINEQYLSSIHPKSNEKQIIAVKSPMGTGKTVSLTAIRKKADQEQTGGIILGTRNNLLIQTAQRLNAYHLHDDSDDDLAKELLVKDQRSWIACCVDSLHYFDPDDFEGKIIILDELASIIPHLIIGNTVKPRRRHILNQLTQCLQRARGIYCLDGNLADWHIEYIKKLSGIKTTEKYFNEYRPAPRDVDFCLGSQWEKNNPNDYKSLIPAILNNPNPKIIVSDSQLLCETMDTILKSEGLKGLRIDRKTSQEDHVKKFLYNPNIPLDYLIYSPSAESGLSIDIKNHYTDLYFFRFFIDTDTAMQMLSRARDTKIRWHIWSKEYSKNNDDGLNSQIARQLYDLVKEIIDSDVKETIGSNPLSETITKLENLINDSENQHYDAWCTLKAMENYDKSNLRDNLLESLKQADHNISIGWHTKEKNDIYSPARTAIIRKNAEDIFNAKDISLSEADRINSSFSSNWDDECKAKKSILINRTLPGVDQLPIWSVSFLEKVFYTDRNMINEIRRRVYFKNRELSELLHKDKLIKLAENSDRFFLGDYRLAQPTVRAIAGTGIADLIGRSFNSDDQLVSKICQRGSDKHRRSLLGRLGNTAPIQYVGKILNKIGLKNKGKRVRIDQETLARKYEIVDKYDKLGPEIESILLADLERKIIKIYGFLPGAIGEGETTSPPTVYPVPPNPILLSNPVIGGTNQDIVITRVQGIPEEGARKDTDKNINNPDSNINKKRLTHNFKVGDIVMFADGLDDFKYQIVAISDKGVAKVKGLLYGQVVLPTVNVLKPAG